MVDADPLVPEEILASAKQRLDAEKITLADNEEILHTLSELHPICERDRSYFVLGNYDREPIRRFNLVVDRLNRRNGIHTSNEPGETNPPGIPLHLNDRDLCARNRHRGVA